MQGARVAADGLRPAAEERGDAGSWGAAAGWSGGGGGGGGGL